MGHIRLGRVPKTKRWTGVFNVLSNDGLDTIELSKAVAGAAKDKYSKIQDNTAINYCFWLLVRISSASRTDNFIEELKHLKINTEDINSGLTFIQQLSTTVQNESIKRSSRSLFVEMAELSLKEVLSSNIVEESKSLFGTSIEDIQYACRKFSTRDRFGAIAREFFSQFMCRTINFITDKEISNYVGPDNSIQSQQQVLDFKIDLSRYCFESAKIIEEFAAGWFSKNNWESNNDITEKATLPFTSYAITKIQMELEKGIE